MDEEFISTIVEEIGHRAAMEDVGDAGAYWEQTIAIATRIEERVVYGEFYVGAYTNDICALVQRKLEMDEGSDEWYDCVDTVVRITQISIYKEAELYGWTERYFQLFEYGMHRA